jgi:hypothetical protein
MVENDALLTDQDRAALDNLESVSMVGQPPDIGATSAGSEKSVTGSATQTPRVAIVHRGLQSYVKVSSVPIMKELCQHLDI